MDFGLLTNLLTMDRLLVLFTALLVIVGLLQWWLIRRQDEHFRTSERAWVLAELGWYKGGLHVAETSGYGVGTPFSETTQANIKLTCRNDGRSPAWIDNVYGQIELRIPKNDPAPDRKSLTTCGPMEPLGPGQERSRVLQLQCPGHPSGNQFLSAYVIVEYRDIFGIKRETTLGYSFDSKGEEIYRQYALPERNRNT